MDNRNTNRELMESITKKLMGESTEINEATMSSKASLQKLSSNLKNPKYLPEMDKGTRTTLVSMTEWFFNNFDTLAKFGK